VRSPPSSAGNASSPSPSTRSTAGWPGACPPAPSPTPPSSPATASCSWSSDDWLRLTAATLVGLAARALEIGVAYVKERHAFGVPIGSFQAVAHPLADAAAAVDGARLLAYEATWAADDAPERARELAALAFGFAGETARDVTARSLHFHGGYGFMMEYDVQLYWRRARAWTNVWGEPVLAYRRGALTRLVG
jgi:hypothetical protein